MKTLHPMARPHILSIALQGLPKVMAFVGARALARMVLVAWLCWLTGTRSWAQDPVAADRVAFTAAVAAMEDGNFDRAAKEFLEFLNKFPESPLRQEASERAEQSKGEAQLRRKEFAAAAATFQSFQQSFPTSPRAILAALGESQARLRIGELEKTVDVLTRTNGAFQTALKTGTPPGALLRGLSMLAEARAGTKNPDAALQAIEAGAKFTTTPLEQWNLQRLAVEIQRDAGRADAAIAAAEKLRELCTQEALKPKRPESAELLANLLEKAGKADKARLIWDSNLTPDVPPEPRKRAVLRSADISLQAGDLPGARQRLEEFMRSAGVDGGDTRVRLLLGQTLFQQYIAARGVRTNNLPPEITDLVAQATLQFEVASTNSTDTAAAPVAQLGRGWCLWERSILGLVTNRLTEAAEAFRVAAETLPHSKDQAVARFKLADCQLALKQPASALTNFLEVSERYKDLATVQTELVEPALLQAALVATDLGRLDTATKAVERLLTLDANNEEVQRSVLLAGQALARAGGGAQARELFAKFSAKFPAAPLRADAQLAIAASFMREENWTNAITVLGPWVTAYATNHSAAPRAEFDLAWASEQAGVATNSVITFRNLVNKYPNHPLAQTALLMLGDRYSARGDFANAEQAYITIYTNSLWKATSAQQHAYLGAAQSALARRSPSTARERLTTLINDPSCPTNLLAEAFFWLGSAWYDEMPESRTNLVGNFIEAINAFSKVAQFAPTHDRTPKAWCLIGQCALQIAAVDPKYYATAATNFVKTLNSSADITWRSRAKVGLANVARKTSQPDAALSHYQDVYYGKLRNPNEDIDPHWTWTAGLEAYRLNLELGRVDDAIKVYQRLGEIFPARKSLLEKELKALK